MSVTTINTIPYNGGTIALHGSDITSVALTNTKFVQFYAQNNPAIVYAHVVNTTGLEGGTATSTNGPQFAFGAAIARIRAWKIASNRLVVLIGNDLRVLEIAADDTIAMKAAKLTAADLGSLQSMLTENMIDSSNAVADAADGMNAGSYFKAFSANDNQLVIAMRSLRYGGATIQTITYNPSTDVFTKSSAVNADFTYNNNFNPSYDLIFAKIPSSTNILVYTVGTIAQNAYGYVKGVKPLLQQAAVYNPTSATFIRLFNVANGRDVTGIAALSDTQLIGFVDGSSYRIHTGSTAVNVTTSTSTGGGTGSFGNAVTFSSTGGNRVCTHAEMISDSYILTTISEPVTTAVNGYSTRAGKQYLRIIRYVDSSFMEVIQSNQDIALSELGVPLNMEMPMVEKVGQYTFVFKSKANSTITDTKINLRSIFGGSE